VKYTKLDENNIISVVEKYVEYYNSEGGVWTIEKATRRIRQIVTMQDSESFVQTSENGQITGFLMGYYKQFDDILLYYLEEIVVFKEFQNKGYGTEMMEHLETIVKANDAEHIELICLNDRMHNHFYEKSGYTASKNVFLMGKHF